MSGLFLDAPVSGAYHLVTWVATAIQPVTGPYAAALAIVLCTAAVRLVLLPLGIAAVRGERSRAAILPQLNEISKRHRDDPERVRREVGKLRPRPARPCSRVACPCSLSCRSSGSCTR